MVQLHSNQNPQEYRQNNYPETKFHTDMNRSHRETGEKITKNQWLIITETIEIIGLFNYN